MFRHVADSGTWDKYWYFYEVFATCDCHPCRNVQRRQMRSSLAFLPLSLFPFAYCEWGETPVPSWHSKGWFGGNCWRWNSKFSMAACRLSTQSAPAFCHYCKPSPPQSPQILAAHQHDAFGPSFPLHKIQMGGEMDFQLLSQASKRPSNGGITSKTLSCILSKSFTELR